MLIVLGEQAGADGSGLGPERPLGLFDPVLGEAQPERPDVLTASVGRVDECGFALAGVRDLRGVAQVGHVPELGRFRQLVEA